MAVYTRLSADELLAFLSAFGLGPPRAFTGIPAGSINSNYFVETDDGRLFLRISEVASKDDLEYEAALLSHLRARGVPTPSLLRTRTGEAFARLAGKWGSLFRYATGVERSADSATAMDVFRVGRALAAIHAAGEGFPLRRAHAFEAAIVSTWIDEIAALRRADLAVVVEKLCAERDLLARERAPSLPRGVIHGDLFPDNVKLDQRGEVSLVFDFEMASDGVLAYDVAVTLLAWCGSTGLDTVKARALVGGYESARALTPPERAGLWAEARQAALRFTVTRIRDFHLRPVASSDRVHKDFRDYLARLDALHALGRDRFTAALFG
jgi:homoserine kinase type II